MMAAEIITLIEKEFSPFLGIMVILIFSMIHILLWADTIKRMLQCHKFSQESYTHSCHRIYSKLNASTDAVEGTIILSYLLLFQQNLCINFLVIFFNG